MRRSATWLCIALAAGAACDDDGGAGDAAPHMDATVTRLDAALASPDADIDVADAASLDATARDTGTPGDAGALDAAIDGGLVLPETLAEAGLYSDDALTMLADGVEAFEPNYFLWSDGATKQRWLYLPPGEQIDTSDMDAWRFPVGTKAFKEFTRDGKRVETRLLYRTPDGWYMMAYAWNAAQTKAVAVPNGVDNALGTDHDIPSTDACRECHDAVPGRLLGVSAIQLSHDKSGLDVLELVAADVLSDAPVGDFRLPNTADWNALGYLHANCGSCHNPDGPTYDIVDMRLWLPVGMLPSTDATPSHTTSVGIALSEGDPGYSVRADPGSADTSGIVHRMELRDGDKQMPPLASKLVDTAGTNLVRAWIDGL